MILTSCSRLTGKTPRLGAATPRCLFLAVLFALLAIGCSKKIPPHPTAPPVAHEVVEESDNDDPCALLDPKEVEAVLGAPLGAPPYRSGGGTGAGKADGDTCIYETKNFRHIALEVDFTNGRTAYSMLTFAKGLLGGGGGNAGIQHAIKQSFKLDDGTELAGEWDEATLTPMTCCNFNALRADQRIGIDFTSTDATLKQAASLVDMAFKRLDKPLKIDGGTDASMAAAAELDKHRTKPVEACSLLTRAEVEALIGELANDPIGKGTQSCTYELPHRANELARTYELVFTWRDGYSKWRSDSHVAKIAVGALGTFVADDARGGDVPAAQTEQMLGNKALAANDAWEHAEFRAMDLAAVKRDVMVEAKGFDGKGVFSENAIKLMTAVMRKL